MAVIYPHEAKVLDLASIMANGPPDSIRLYQNDITPDADSVLADFTEADFSGYVGVAPTFGATTINGDDNAQRIALVCIFLHSGGVTPNDIFGWYMVNGAAGVLKFAERFADAPRVMAGLADEIDITPAITQGGCP